MGTRNEFPRTWLVGGLTRPLLAYIVIVILGVWAYGAVRDGTQGRDLAGAVLAVAAAFRNSIVLLPFFSALLLPAMVLTIELIHRFEADTIAARAVVGAASWVGWGLFVAITLAVASRVVLVLEPLAVALSLLAASGAVYSALAFDGHQTRSGKALVVLALATIVLVVLGSSWMAGRWGGPA